MLVFIEGVRVEISESIDEKELRLTSLLSEGRRAEYCARVSSTTSA